MRNVTAKTRLQSTTGILLAVAGLVVATPSVAQTLPEEDAGNEIVVTANKRSERLKDVAMGISAIGADDLADRKLVSLADYGTTVPGLAVQQQTPIQNRLTIRGLNAGGSGASVGIYLDDSPIGSSSGLAGGALNTLNANSWDLQRIEVLRGPQGTLYGANSEGGLFKYVSNSPRLGAFEGAAEIGMQAVDGGNAAGSVKGMLNLPFAEGTGALRVSGYYEGLPGYIDNILLGDKNANKGRSIGGRAAVEAAPTDTLNIRLTGFYQTMRTGGTPYVDVIGTATSYASPPANIFAPSGRDLEQERFLKERFEFSLFNASAAVNWRLPFAELVSITSYSYSKLDYLIDWTANVATYGAPVTPGAPQGSPITYGQYTQSLLYGVPTNVGLDTSLPFRKFTQEIRLASSGSSPLQWQVGGMFTRESGRNTQHVPAFDRNTGAALVPDPGTVALSSVYREYAGFASATYRFSPKFDVEIGGRFARNEQTNSNNIGAGPLAGGPFVTNNQSGEDVFTYSIAPRWQIDPDTLAYARVASGYKPGGPNNITTLAQLPADYPLTFESESTVNYELGLRKSLFDRLLSVDVNLFYIDWKDIQIFTRFGPYSVRTNGSKASSKGAEWTIELKPLRDFRITWTGAFVDAKLGADGGGGMKGDQLPYVPKLSTSLDTGYGWDIAQGARATLGATISYNGKQYSDFSRTVQLSPHTEIPGYTTVALRAGLEYEGTSIDLFVKNLTNSRGITLYSNSGAPGFDGYKGIIAPRTFGITLRKTI